MQIWHISVLNGSCHISHWILAGFPNSPQTVSTPVDGINGWCSPMSDRRKGFTWVVVDTVHSFMCVLWACLLFEEKATFQVTRKTAAVQDLQSMVVSQSLQIVCRKDFSNWILSFKSFWCKKCWTGWFSYLLITQYIFFTAAQRESSHIWAGSQDMGSTSRSLIFYGSWEQHCPQWELPPRAQLSSFSHGG